MARTKRRFVIQEKVNELWRDTPAEHELKDHADAVAYVIKEGMNLPRFRIAAVGPELTASTVKRTTVTEAE